MAGAQSKWEADHDQKGSVTYDSAGQFIVPKLSDHSAWLAVHISKEGLTPLINFWNADPLKSDSPNFDFQMEKAGRIAGQVLDEAAKPIAGGTVTVSVRKKYQQSKQEVDLHWIAITADAKGKWSLDGVPTDPDKLEICAIDPLHLTGEYYNTEEYKPRSQLFDGTAQIILPTGTPVNITVLKPDGTSAAGAEVFLGRDRRISNFIPPLKTDAQGKAIFGCKPAMAYPLTASLPGFGPTQETVSVNQSPIDVKLKLAPPTLRTIEVIDSAGKPIGAAEIHISNWHGSSVLDTSLTTDNNGQAAWKDGPADNVVVSIYADGYMGKDQINWPANKSTRVVLVNPQA